MRAGIPDSVRVGSVRYRIVQDAAEIARVSGRNNGDDTEWSAFSSHDRLVIGVNPDHAPDRLRQDVLHELLHCCLEQSGCEPGQYARMVSRADGEDDGYGVEEMTVSGMTGLLLGCLRDNPDLLAWLTA